MLVIALGSILSASVSQCVCLILFHIIVSCSEGPPVKWESGREIFFIINNILGIFTYIGPFIAVTVG